MTDLDSTRHDQFLRLFTTHEPAVRSFVRSLLPTREDAHEVMQEVALVLWRKFDDFATGEDFRKWAFGVARYEVLAYARDKARDRHVFGPEVIELLARDAEQSASRLEAQRESLEVCLEKLPAHQRSLVTQAYTPGARIGDLATRMGRTAMAVYKLLHRIRLALAECTRARLLEKGIS
jgi:RNA polymerase sigma-70 factor (ECF subfamily)